MVARHGDPHPSADGDFDTTIRPDERMRNYHIGAVAGVLERLGPNYHSSTSEDRLSEARTWPDYNVAFDIERGKIAAVCVTEAVVRFGKEHRYEEPIAGTKMRKVTGASNPDYCYEPSEQKMKPAGTCSWQQEPIDFRADPDQPPKN